MYSSTAPRPCRSRRGHHRPLADLCIYIVREGVLDRRQLPDIERLYREKKFRNMCVVLNGTRTAATDTVTAMGTDMATGTDTGMDTTITRRPATASA